MLIFSAWKRGVVNSNEADCLQIPYNAFQNEAEETHEYVLLFSLADDWRVLKRVCSNVQAIC